ncbi:UNVERIFIED_CONTAM: hypothetical protein Slati_2893500 [Sesamum latifolium]|uniref:DUF8040 domain-containing protein n=1 Tax=Sesamum latifolium TaxID=2727402 RepID=A0AAW2VGB7_9LAMI
MSKNAFGRLCQILETSTGLRGSRHLTVSEQVAIFLNVLAHQKKNRVVKHDFIRSGRTISKHFHSILRAVLRVQLMLLARPFSIGEECQDSRWRWFKGSVADGRVLRDAISRPTGLKVPTGKYYFCDNGYADGEDFLTLIVIVVAYCLLHNYVRMEMPDDPLESEVPEYPNNSNASNTKFVGSIETMLCSLTFNQPADNYVPLQMNPEEGSSNPRRYREKPDKTRRTWTQREEEALVNALRTICGTSWRCENGFTAGYLNQLEALMFKQFSNIDLRAEPHINSKIHV